MTTIPSQQSPGSSLIVTAAAWLFVLIVTAPIGCGVLVLGGFALIVATSQVPDWLTDASIVLVVLLGLVAHGLALWKVVRGVLRKRQRTAAHR